MSIVNYGRRGVCGSRSNISRITSKALCDICRYCCVRSELAFIRSAKDNVCLARMSFDRRKSTQITLSRNMTHSSHVGRLYRQRAIAMPRSPERLILLEQPLETRPDVRGCERIAARQGKTASAPIDQRASPNCCPRRRSAARKVAAWRRPTRVYPQSAHSYLLNCADRELDAAVSQLDWRGEIGG